MELFRRMREILYCIIIAYFADTCLGNKTALAPAFPESYTYSDMQIVADKVPAECVNFTFGYLEFYSPYFPTEYPNNVDCVRTIEAQPGFEIHLDFEESFDIEEAEGGGCKFDYLEVREGPFAYSTPSHKYCGKKFPPYLVSATRFLWLRFKSDDNERKGGFKGIISQNKKKNGGHNAKEERRLVCRDVFLNPSGVLSSSSMTTLINGNVDCTWVIRGDPKSRILLSVKKLEFVNSDCRTRKVEIYGTTTRYEDRREELCEERTPSVLLDTSLVFIRVFAVSLSLRPKVEIAYTILPPTGADGCSPREFSCDNSCISSSLRCDGHRNCPSGEDEANCPGTVAGQRGGKSVPMYIIVGGAVGGVVLTGILLTIIIVACNSKKSKRDRKQKERELAIEQDRLKDKNIEMTGTNSSTMSSKKGQAPPGYYSLPRPQPGGKSGSFKDSIHRNSLTNSLQSPSSEGEYGDQSSDPGTYKRFMVMDQFTNIEDETSPCPSLYNQGPILTTIVERHDIPPQTEIDGTYGWSGYGWKPSPNDPRSPSSLSENLAKLAKYNMPQKAYHYTGNPDTKLYYPEHKYDMNPEQQRIVKDYKMKYGTPQEKEATSNDEQNLKKQFKLKSQHPDITRDLEVKT